MNGILKCQWPAHLATGELAEVWFEVVSDHCMDGHQAKHTGFPHTAFRVVVTLLDKHTTYPVTVEINNHPRLPVDVPDASHLYESWDDLGQHAGQALSGNSLHHLRLHFDSSQVDGVISWLNNWTQHFDALVWTDGQCQHGSCLLRSADHLQEKQRKQALFTVTCDVLWIT